MTIESHETRLRWFLIRRTKLTREYIGGLLGGFGLGGVVATYLHHKDFVDTKQFPIELWLLGFSLIAIGSAIASGSQRRQIAD